MTDSSGPTTQALIEKARQAVDRFIDFASEHGMHGRQLNPLVLDIHDALDAFEEQSNTGRAAADALRSLPPPVVGTYDFDHEARRVTEAIGSDNGWMTIRCALTEAFAAGQRAAEAEVARLTREGKSDD